MYYGLLASALQALVVLVPSQIKMSQSKEKIISDITLFNNMYTLYSSMNLTKRQLKPNLIFLEPKMCLKSPGTDVGAAGFER